MSETNTSQFWKLDVNYWINNLSSSSDGLSHFIATNRLNSEIKSKRKLSRFQKDLLLFASQYKSPLMILLIGAVILSAFLGDHSDVYIILTIVLSTGSLSFIQERNASKVVEKLQSMITIKSEVLRDGNVVKLATNLIVPGDIILLKAGDIVPADCMLIELNELNVNESSLTGESFPVRKELKPIGDISELSNRINCIWEGTHIVSGTAKALVINTGDNTIFGAISSQASFAYETSFEKGIKKFGYFLMTITLLLSVFILIVNLSAHKSIVESALFALALAVGMAPELLPAITTIAMSAGAKKMLEKKVIVKKLTSIQNLGEVNLLCTDKTGTITEGRISVKGIADFRGNESELVKKLAFWNASLQSGYGNPIDDALKQLNLDPKTIPVKLDEVPYDFTRKKITVLVDTPMGRLMITKGAFNEILEICTKVKIDDTKIIIDNSNEESIIKHSESLRNIYDSFGLAGYRTIAICYKFIDQLTIQSKEEQDMVFAGFIQLEDPIKSDIIDTIAALNRLSVELKIITGDNKNIAMSIALKLGIKNPVLLTGKEVQMFNNTDLLSKINDTHIFAEVEPQQKERIIQLLKNSYTVAYIGDGINDVSAINIADVGISVDNAVDIAKEAADFVLMEKNLMVIVDGIQEGRKTFTNTLKYIFINTGSTFGNMFSVVIASLYLPFLPMLPKQILLTNFITDLPYLSISSDNVDKEQIQKPGKWDLKLIRRYMVLFGIHSTLFDLCTFYILLNILKVKEGAFQTGWFVESILTELLILFIIRTPNKFFKSKPGKYLIILSILALIVTVALPYTALGTQVGLVAMPLKFLLVMISIVLAYIVTADMLKVWFFRKYQ